MTSLNTVSQLALSDLLNARLLQATTEGNGDGIIDGMQLQQPGDGLDISMMVQASDFPSDNCCYLYDENYFGGSRKEFCQHGHEETFNLYNYSFDDTVKSYKCGSETTIILCNDEWTEGYCEEYSQSYLASSSGHVQVKSIGNEMRNDVGSIRLKPYDYIKHGAVTVFDQADCWGYSASFEHTGYNGNVETLYGYQDLWDAGIGTDYIASVMVPEGYIVDIYEDDSQGGDVETIRGGYTDQNKRMVCHNLWLWDEADSLVIRPQSQGSAIGRWEPIVLSTESINYQKVVGLTSSNTSTSSNEMQLIMSASMTLGLEFEGVGGAEYGIEQSYAAMIRNDVEHSYTQSDTETIETTCTVPAGESGAGLWQWVVSTEDGSITSRHLLSICKTGEGWNKQPKCPIHACVDGKCDNCVSDWRL